MRRLVVMSAVLVVVAACSRHKVTVSPTNPSPRPLTPRLTASVEVFTAAAPQRPFAEVAVLTANWGDAEKDIEAIRDKAGEYGCDAVVFSRIGSSEAMHGQVQSTKPGEPGRNVYGSSVTKSAATCIVWTEPQPATAASPEPEGLEGGVVGGVVGAQ